MSINFKLEYTNGGQYIDIFPQTTVEGIIDRGNNNYNTVFMQVTIPAYSSLGQQIISIDTTGNLENYCVQMYLLNSNEQTNIDYATIDQFEVQTNQLIINRLYTYPTNDIDIELVFFKTGE